jgi:hypothetical protein
MMACVFARVSYSLSDAHSRSGGEKEAGMEVRASGSERARAIIETAERERGDIWEEEDRQERKRTEREYSVMDG